MTTILRSIYYITRPFIVLYNKTIKPVTSGSRAIVLFGKKVLLVKNIGKNYWSFPGGRIEKHETPEYCLMREIKEELDILVGINYKLGTYDARNEGKHDCVHIYVAEVDSEYFKPQWELDDAQWFDLDSLPEGLSPATRRRLKEFKNGDRELSALIW